MLLVSLLTSSLAPSIRIQRVEADSNLLFPENSQRLTKFMMDATYGAVRPFSPAWAQRSVLGRPRAPIRGAWGRWLELATARRSRVTSPRGG